MPGATYSFFPFTERTHTPKTVELTEATLAVDAEAAKLCAGLSESNSPGNHGREGGPSPRISPTCAQPPKCSCRQLIPPSRRAGC